MATNSIAQLDSSDDVILEIFADLMGEWIIEDRDICLEDCQICLEPMYGTYTITTGCKHTFHRNCLFKNLLDFAREQCPVCSMRFLFLDKINESKST
jgi:hypothetical protein